MSIFYARFGVPQPEPITHDSRGTLIEIGARVAYSGPDGMTIGTIQKINKNVWECPYKSGDSWFLKFVIEILNEGGNLHKIKAAANFIII